MNLENKVLYQKIVKLLVYYFGQEIIKNNQISIHLPDSIYFKNESNKRLFLGSFYKEPDGKVSLLLNVSVNSNDKLNDILLKAYEKKTFKRVVALRRIIDNYFSDDSSILYLSCSIDNNNKIVDCFYINYLISEIEYTIDFLNDYYNNKEVFNKSFLYFVEDLMNIIPSKKFTLKDILYYGKTYQLMKY